MEQLNIKNLFPSSNPVTENKPLSVSTLYNHKENIKQNKIDFTIEKLLDVQEERKKKVIDEYRKSFNLILKKITDANKLGYYDLIFDVPYSAYMCPEYNITDCLDFVERRLRKIYMDTLRMGTRSIFISWSNLENNRKASENEC